MTEVEYSQGLLILDNLSDYYKVPSDRIYLLKMSTIDTDEMARCLSDEYDITFRQAMDILNP